MASIPPIRKFYIEDYPTQKTWIGPFLLILNQFVQAIVSALNGTLTIVQNTTSDIRQIALSSVPTSTIPVSFAWNKRGRPVAVIVGNVTLRSTIGTSYTLSSAVQVQWQMSSEGDSVQLTHVSGITPSSSDIYTLTLVCIAG